MVKTGIGNNKEVYEMRAPNPVSLRDLTLTFINGLRETNSYKVAKEEFIDFLKSDKYENDKQYVLIFNFDDSIFEVDEYLKIDDRVDNKVILDYSVYWQGKPELNVKSYY